MQLLYFQTLYLIDLHSDIASCIDALPGEAALQSIMKIKGIFLFRKNIYTHGVLILLKPKFIGKVSG